MFMLFRPPRTEAVWSKWFISFLCFSWQSGAASLFKLAFLKKNFFTPIFSLLHFFSIKRTTKIFLKNACSDVGWLMWKFIGHVYCWQIVLCAPVNQFIISIYSFFNCQCLCKLKSKMYETLCVDCTFCR